MPLNDFTWTEGSDLFEWSGNLGNYEPIYTLDGDDAIIIRVTSTTSGLFNSSAIDTGGGDDTLLIISTSFIRANTGLEPGNISLGIGNDKIIVQGEWSTGLIYLGNKDNISTIDLGEGNDQIYAEGYGDNAFRFLYGEILGGNGDDKITTKCLTNQEGLQALYLNNSSIDLASNNDEIEVINGNIFLIDSTIFMGSGSDTIRCAGAIDGFNSSIDLGEGNDLIIAKSIGSNAGFSINGGAGIDTVETSSSYSLGANFERLILRGSRATNGNGNTLNNTLTGNAANNVLNGGAGADKLNGGAGNDSLIGSTGRDNLTGSTGVDKFIYRSIKDSGVGSASRDVITDFRGASGEKIDLSAIDAYTKTTGNQAFAFIGSKGFTGTRGEVRFANGILQLNTGTDKTADMEIALTGVSTFSSTFLVL